MKKMIVLVGLMMSVVTAASAGEIIKMPMLDYVATPEMDYVYEIKTTKFDKVLLDCQSLISGMTFSNKGVEEGNVKLDMFMCEELLQYLYESNRDGAPVCIGLDNEASELYFTRETEDECK